LFLNVLLYDFQIVYISVSGQGAAKIKIRFEQALSKKLMIG
jgi:hypothetical protein